MDVMGLVCCSSLPDCHAADPNEGGSDAALAILAISETMFYWSHLKAPPQAILIATALPYAFALIAASQTKHHGALLDRMVHCLGTSAPLGVMLIVGIVLLNTRKMDTYAFGNLVVAVVGKTSLLCPAWIEHVQYVLHAVWQCLSDPLALHLAPFKWIYEVHHRLSPAPTNVRPVIRHLRNLTTSVHLRATVLLFVVDAIWQHPKGWSTPARQSWGLGIAVLLVEALKKLMARRGENHDLRIRGSVSSEGKGGIGSDRTAHVIILALRHGACSLLAILCINFGPPIIRHKGVAALDTSTSIHVRWFGLIILIWTVLWLLTKSPDPLRAKSKPADAPSWLKSQGKTKARRFALKQNRRIRRILIGIAAVPLALVAVKHGQSGNALVGFCKQVNTVSVASCFDANVHADSLIADRL
jgi:hypothetical protein